MHESKSRKRLLRQLLSEAYRRELTRALEALFQDFRHWQSGDIDPFELNERIHRYHQHEARAIWSRYNLAPPSTLILASAIRAGLMTIEEMPDELREQLTAALAALGE